MGVNFGLSDRVVVVTGGASGIGRATVDLAIADGAKVAIVDWSEDAVGATVDELRAGGAAVAGYVADVRSHARMLEVVDAVERELGDIHGVVACAGVSRPAKLLDMSQEDFETVIDINLVGMYNTANAAGARMVARRRGSFVAIGSTDALGGHVDRTHYAASKHGVAGLIKSVAIEWGPHNVRANAVCPGAVDTPLVRAIHDEASVQKNFLSKIPLGRLATGEDQARGSLFLLSDAAEYISGIMLPIDGGLTAGYFNQMN